MEDDHKEKLSNGELKRYYRIIAISFLMMMLAIGLIVTLYYLSRRVETLPQTGDPITYGTGTLVNLCGSSVLPPEGWAEHDVNPSCTQTGKRCYESGYCEGPVIRVYTCSKDEEMSDIKCGTNESAITAGGVTLADHFNESNRCKMVQIDVYADSSRGSLTDFVVWKGSDFDDPNICEGVIPTSTPKFTPTPTQIRSSDGGIINIHQGVSVKISGLTFKNGFALGDGGAVYNEGILDLVKSKVSNSTALMGGGIYNKNVLNIYESEISGNTAFFQGGGIMNSKDMEDDDLQAVLAIYDTSVNNNQVLDSAPIGFGTSRSEIAADGAVPLLFGGGGIVNQSGLLIFERSLAANNSAIGSFDPYFYTGGAIQAYGTELEPSENIITNSTISNNIASAVDGLYIHNANVEINYSTIAYNVPYVDMEILPENNVGGIYLDGVSDVKVKGVIVSDNRGDQCGGSVAITSKGYNIEVFDTAPTCGFNFADDQEVQTPVIFAVLSNNGGLTATHMIIGGGLAQDKGELNACVVIGGGSILNEDHRSQSRPFGLNCDVGAVELQEIEPSMITPTDGPDPQLTDTRVPTTISTPVPEMAEAPPPSSTHVPVATSTPVPTQSAGVSDTPTETVNVNDNRELISPTSGGQGSTAASGDSEEFGKREGDTIEILVESGGEEEDGDGGMDKTLFYIILILGVLIEATLLYILVRVFSDKEKN